MLKKILHTIYRVKDKDYEEMGMLKKIIMLAFAPLVIVWVFIILFLLYNNDKLIDKIEWVIFGIIVGAVAIGLSMLISKIISAL